MLITWVYLLVKDKLLVWWRHRGSKAAKRCPRSGTWRVGKGDVKQGVAIVTGASSGLGLATTRELAKEGFHVVLACRSVGSGEKAAASIRASFPKASLQVSVLDLCLYKSILAFADSVEALVGNGTEHGPLRLLVNNAGVFTLTQRWTDDRIDRMIASNYLGHFILTNRLLPLLQKAAPNARVVNVGSWTHRAANFVPVRRQLLASGFDGAFRLGGPQFYTPAYSYQASKLCIIAHALALHKRCYQEAKESRRVSVNVADPGFIYSALLREVPGWLHVPAVWIYAILRLMHPARVGAQTVLDAALADPTVSGQYFFGGQGRTLEPSKVLASTGIVEDVWRESCAIQTDLRLQHGGPHIAVPGAS
ncbi:NAD(P)-binding Rossmann-fold superfamily protein [Klebsormidium nitens]|uniref:NAD(P)-binding Rossmann-fold superfamily protein n=1 Tax=Klebsormidium nitens TaxID=105231 RepID=A0A1Y1IQ77_KLENI|nr:NAD(P)-binding Rossmann-fold superfamily protein [Klebsormidium nitens]|eukprot:GAQ90777.1 NAD(P)-binding Rossmann-fold superfamily protein [Klebsormidium nitens]